MPDSLEFTVRKSYLLLAVVGLLLFSVLYTGILGSIHGMVTGQNPDRSEHDTSDEPELRERFNALRTAGTNSCGANPQTVEYLPDSQRMQGSCCSAMNFHSYEEQIEGLQADYSSYDIIPSDPYNVSVKWAKQMIVYNEDTELTEKQQSIYDEATELSHEGGPCCCKCWHWYAYGGLGKKLIIEHDFTAEQVAQVWDLSDACGGNHAHT